MKGLFTVLFLFSYHLGFAQILSGPMIGHQTPEETKIWLQTANPISFTLVYGIKDDTIKNKVQLETVEENWNTLSVTLSRLSPGEDYEYRIISNGEVIFNGKFSSPEYVNSKSLSDYTFALGSCTYVNDATFDRRGEPFGRALEIIKNIENQHPDLMLWLGDNIYLRKGEWTSKTGIYRRYTDFKSQPELQSFWQNTTHYAIWDDHDFGPNDGDRSFANKELTLQAFKDFWANPGYGINGQSGITTMFSYQDVDFFLLDNRYFRSPNKRKTGERQILGKEQIEWLIDALINSKASFKFIAVGGQVLSDAAVYENYATYPTEQKYLLELIEKEGLKNIIFLTGDRHKTELSELELDNGITLYDFTSSPMAAKAYDSENEGNNRQVKGTHVSTQNFGTISVKGSFDKRMLQLKTFDAEGNLLWDKEISRQ